MTFDSVLLIAVLSRPRVTTTAMVITPRTTAYSAIVWPDSSRISVCRSRMKSDTDVPPNCGTARRDEDAAGSHLTIRERPGMFKRHRQRSPFRWPVRVSVSSAPVATIIDGKQIAADVRRGVARDVAALRERSGHTPGLVTILVGEDPASEVYVRNKIKACEEAGMAS